MAETVPAIDRLEPYLRQHLPAFGGPLAIQPLRGGQSNPTYVLHTPQRNYVLRKKPAGTLAPSAHAVDREFRVMRALRATGVPVPEALVLCTDQQVIGEWFYVMSHVEGRVFRDQALPEIARGQRAAYFDAVNAVLARLHTLDFAALGLADYGKPHGYLTRQLLRWREQYLQDRPVAGEVGAIERLLAWLPAHQPKDADHAALIHGDFRFDNLIFHPDRPSVVAVVDWELSTVGDRLADFAYHLLMYRMPTLAFPGLLGADLETLGLPTEAAYVEAYCARAGGVGIESLDFYIAFCLFRLACIFHGIRTRLCRGNAAGATAKDYARHVEAIAELGWSAARDAGDR